MRQYKGFTLIELMIVIAIVGLTFSELSFWGQIEHYKILKKTQIKSTIMKDLQTAVSRIHNQILSSDNKRISLVDEQQLSINFIDKSYKTNISTDKNSILININNKIHQYFNLIVKFRIEDNLLVIYYKPLTKENIKPLKVYYDLNRIEREVN